MTPRVPGRRSPRSVPGPPGVLDVLGPTAYAEKGVAQLRRRIGLPSGVMSGDVTSHEAVLWARGDGAGRLTARLSSGAHVGRVLHGPQVDSSTAFTGRLDLTGLLPGRDYEAAVWFEGLDGTRGEVGQLAFRTAPHGRRATSFVWTGGTAGGGWGINPDVGGMTGYAAMHHTNPDFFVHAGGLVHAADEIPENRIEPDGLLWRNLVTPEVSKVAETLAEFRGRHAYHLLDDNVRTMYADTPLVPQWDDVESQHGWIPGRLLDDERYGERRTDVLAARARRAWQEFQPIGSQAVHGRGSDGFASDRIYRRLERGPLLDLFCLDMRLTESGDLPLLHLPLLGHEQTEWLVRELARSTARWKVVVADLPLAGVPLGGDGPAGPVRPAGEEPDLLRVLRGMRDHQVRDVVWISAGTRGAAAHHCDPQRADVTDFDPFWEFVAGPIHAGASEPSALDATLGPVVEFHRSGTPGESPRAGNQFFGHVAIDAAAAMTVSLRDARGRVLHTTRLEPSR